VVDGRRIWCLGVRAWREGSPECQEGHGGDVQVKEYSWGRASGDCRWKAAMAKVEAGRTVQGREGGGAAVAVAERAAAACEVDSVGAAAVVVVVVVEEEMSAGPKQDAMVVG